MSKLNSIFRFRVRILWTNRKLYAAYDVYQYADDQQYRVQDSKYSELLKACPNDKRNIEASDQRQPHNTLDEDEGEQGKENFELEVGSWIDGVVNYISCDEDGKSVELEEEEELFKELGDSWGVEEDGEEDVATGWFVELLDSLHFYDFKNSRGDLNC